MLYAVHLGIAKIVSVREVAITEDEADEYAKAVQRVSDLYDVNVIPEEWAAWIGLITTVGGIYGPRVMAIIESRKRKPKIVEMPFVAATEPAQPETTQ